MALLPCLFVSNSFDSVHFCVYASVLCYLWQLLVSSGPLVMSTPTNMPNSISQALSGHDCPTCGCFVLFKACQSDVNRNRGRLTLSTGHLVHGRRHIYPRYLHLLFGHQTFLSHHSLPKFLPRSVLLNVVDRSALHLIVHHSGAESTVLPSFKEFAPRKRTSAWET